MIERELELAGFHVVMDDEELVWGEQAGWSEETVWRGEEDYPVAPCRTIEVTEEVRQADMRQREEREAARRASITWTSPVAAKIAEMRLSAAAESKFTEAEPKRPAVYLFPAARVHRIRREVA